jgi:hypothetical protein
VGKIERSDKAATRLQRRSSLGSQGSYQLTNLVVIAGGYKNHPIALYAKR